MGLLDNLGKDLLGGLEQQIANQAETTINNATKNIPGNQKGELTGKVMQLAEEKLGIKSTKATAARKK